MSRLTGAADPADHLPPAHGCSSPRWVGDPVDVITGNHTDVALDFRLTWQAPFEWRRYYTTARCHELLPLGWGHTHGYDHRLEYSVDGLIYTDPGGHRSVFPLASVAACAVPGASLQRRGEHIYHVKARGFPRCEFHFDDPSRPAQLRRLFYRLGYHELRYAGEGWLSTISTADEDVVRVETSRTGQITALFLVPDREERDRRERLLWQGSYDSAGTLVRATDPYGNDQTFSSDAAHRVIRRTDRRGYGFEFEYDPLGRCVRSAGEDGVFEVQLDFDPETRLTRVTRADGGQWQHFRENGRIHQLVDPYGGVRVWQYGDAGELLGEIGPMGEWVQVVDGSGSIRRPLEPRASMCHLRGDPWFDELRRTYLPHDALGWEGLGERACRNVIRLPIRGSLWMADLPTAARRAVRTAERPEEGPLPPPRGFGPKPIGVPPAPGGYQLDPFGAIQSFTDASGNTERWQYDGNGNITRWIDADGSEWRYEYASWNQRVAEMDPVGNATRFGYSLLDKQNRVVDPGGTETERIFDLKDRRVEIRRNGEPRDRFAYDLSEGLTEVASADSTRLRLKHGKWARPVEIEPTGRPMRECAYDDEGRLVGVVDTEHGSLEFAYEDLHRRTRDQSRGRGVSRRHAAYELAEIAVLDRFVTRYEVDEATGSKTLTDPAGGRHHLEQLQPGIYRRRHPNGVEELMQFDWKGRCLCKIRLDGGLSSQAWSRAYVYSPVGALVEATDSRLGTTRYRYDAAHRLVGEQRSDGRERTYRHDAAGNLLEAPGLEEVSYAGNRLLTANGRQFIYDERHNVSAEVGEGRGREYTYDVEDRLVSWTSGGEEVAFQYDSLGRRISKTFHGRITEFIWDGERLAAEIAPGGMLRVYVYADGAGLTPIAFIDYPSLDADPASGQRRYVFGNQIGCPIRVEDDAGAVLWSAEIEAYGRARVSSSASIEFNLRWPGHYSDSETGLHYNRHRYYSPELGRYIQVDPRDLEGGINLYAATPRPLDQVDVDGLAPCPQKDMIQPDENSPEFKAAKAEADAVEQKLAAAIARSEQSEGGAWPGAYTLTTMVVVDSKGNYRVVVTGNTNYKNLPKGVRQAIPGGKNGYIAWGGSPGDAPPTMKNSPPSVGKGDEDSRHPRTSPRSGETEPTTHKHAEQRGLRATDCDPSVKGVAYIAPTRPCCEGCSSSIQSRGGTDSNVSDKGRNSEFW